MLQIVRKVSAVIISGTASMILAACYGSPMDMDGVKYISITSENDEPIEGLEVKLLQNSEAVDTVLTNAQGVAGFYGVYENSEADHSIEITDIDGPANGGSFITQTHDITLDENYSIKVKLQQQ